ncbi:CRISPR system Cascade subunit CasB [Streptomyces harbinensis]|uniref:CRISPR system Cascade subunit CasB n=1 Tax=Streptomyces harbinensis TaxID=1176198 RepID=A0A1I6PUG2_9ACTN|nr:CRISPR system Cascade subunit CasB [Streptomyces harbinensis]
MTDLVTSDSTGTSENTPRPTPGPGAAGTRAETPENTPARTPRYWNRYVTAGGTWRVRSTGQPIEPPGEDLAALRSGLGRPAGDVFSLWAFYTTPCDGHLPPRLEAEHAALALYGLHQQSRRDPMHRPHVGLGTALAHLRNSGRFGAEALDRRVDAAANATSVSSLRHRLRGLVTQLRTGGQPLDYDMLLEDLHDWRLPDRRRRVRRRWGLEYYARKPEPLS